MPVDDFIDIRLTLSDKDLRELDEAISNAKAKLSEASPIPGSGAAQGQGITGRLFAFASNPAGFLTSTIVGAAGVGFILTVTERVLAEIQRIDRFFKQFVDIVDTRIDQIRSNEQRALIAAGQTQIIITTAAGSTDPREAYNTFEQFNNNRSALEAEFAIRNTSGYE